MVNGNGKISAPISSSHEIAVLPTTPKKSDKAPPQAKTSLPARGFPPNNLNQTRAMHGEISNFPVFPLQDSGPQPLNDFSGTTYHDTQNR
jgi:hypothetical protein